MLGPPRGLDDRPRRRARFEDGPASEERLRPEGEVRSPSLRHLLVVLAFCACAGLLARGPIVHGQGVPPADDSSQNVPPRTRVPTGSILVKGAWSSASDSVTPLPEGGRISDNAYANNYFGLNYPLPRDWFQKFEGPPPSESGRYVLAQITPTDAYKGPSRGNILITAQDMFFSPLPAANALELVKYTKDHLQAEYKVELEPREAKIAGRSFAFFAYRSPAAGLHWYVLATQIRCHAVQLVLTSRDPKLLESLTQAMNNMKLPEEASPTGGTGGGAVPLCTESYAREENVIARTDPVFTEQRSNPVPVRIIIDEEGKVRHIHFLSAFPDQARAITDALKQWQFRPCVRNGQPVEVETGLMFGRAPSPLR
jgi:hypothetical protein